jgi:hypothetical protein
VSPRFSFPALFLDNDSRGLSTRQMQLSSRGNAYSIKYAARGRHTSEQIVVGEKAEDDTPVSISVRRLFRMGVQVRR